MKRMQRNNMGSKYFGRVIRRFRLQAGLSQEELAERAQLSVRTVGAVERERGPLAEEICIKLSLGLESALGRPMLRCVFVEGMEGLWNALLTGERSFREERGLQPAEYGSRAAGGRRSRGVSNRPSRRSRSWRCFG